MTADSGLSRAQRLPFRAKLEILGAALLAAGILGIGWYNLDRKPDMVASEPGIAGNAAPAVTPRPGPRIVGRPATPAEEPPAPAPPDRAAQDDDVAGKPPSRAAPSTDTPADMAEHTAYARTRLLRLIETSRDATESGDPVTGALLSLEALADASGVERQAVHRALYAAHFARREIAVLGGHRRFVRTAAFSPDGARIVTASRDKTARLWNARTGASIAILEGHDGEILTAAFNGDGSRIVTASVDGTARLWTAADGRPATILRGHAGRVRGAVFSPDGRVVATVSSDTTARLWKVADGSAIAVLRGHEKYLSAAAFDGAGNRLVTASADGTARIWDLKIGAQIAVLRGHGSYVNSAVFSPDGKRVATASWGDRTARLWDAASGTEIAVLRGHSNWVNTANFSPDGGRVATASGDGTARLWDAANGSLIAVLGGHGGYVYSARFSPDGQTLLTASGDGTARLWNARDGAAVTRIRSGTAPSEAPRVTTSPDDRLFASMAEDNTVQVLDRETGRTIVLRGHRDRVNSVDFNEAGTRLVTASADGTARLWDTASGVEIAVLRQPGLASARFTADGGRIVTRDGDGVTRQTTIFASLDALAAHLKSVLPRELTRQQRRQNSLEIRR